MTNKIRILTKIMPVAILILLICSMAYAQESKKAITEEEAKVIIENILKIWNEGKVELIPEHSHPDLVIHHSGSPQDVLGFEGFKGLVLSNRTAYPDFQLTFDEIIAKDDKIVVLWTMTGTNTGPMGELPPTGKKVSLTGISLVSIVDGKFAEEWIIYNSLDLMMQLGFTIVPPQPPKKE